MMRTIFNNHENLIPDVFEQIKVGPLLEGKLDTRPFKLTQQCTLDNKKILPDRPSV